MDLEIGRAVKTDSHMATNVPGIYACGDCAEYEGINYAIWPEAVEQGRIAGANAAGEELEYEPVEAALTFHGMNTRCLQREITERIRICCIRQWSSGIWEKASTEIFLP